MKRLLLLACLLLLSPFPHALAAEEPQRFQILPDWELVLPTLEGFAPTSRYPLLEDSMRTFEVDSNLFLAGYYPADFLENSSSEKGPDTWARFSIMRSMIGVDFDDNSFAVLVEELKALVDEDIEKLFKDFEFDKELDKINDQFSSKTKSDFEVKVEGLKFFRHKTHSDRLSTICIVARADMLGSVDDVVGTMAVMRVGNKAIILYLYRNMRAGGGIEEVEKLAVDWARLTLAVNK